MDEDTTLKALVVDTFTAGHLAAVLAATPLTGPTVTLDLAGLDFIDAAGTRTLALWAAGLPAATTVRVVRAPRLTIFSTRARRSCS